jgi:Mrp family chromosome partitioning ATPase/capsular polysaccharide biosynthesis protein
MVDPMETATTPPLVQDELDLRRYLDVLRRRKWEVLLVVVLVGVLAVLYTASQTSRYRASAEVLLRSSPTEQIVGGAGDFVPTDQNATAINVQTEIEYMKSRTVRDAVRKELGYEPAVTIGTVSQAGTDTEVVTIRATSVDAERAARAANVYARTYTNIRRDELSEAYTGAVSQMSRQVEVLLEEVRQVEAPLDVVDAQLATAVTLEQVNALWAWRNSLEADLEAKRDPTVNRLDRAKDRLASLELALSTLETGGAQIISRAEVPERPYTPKPVRNGIMALIVGLLLGVGFAFLRESLDSRVHSISALERLTGWSVIGVLPKRRRKSSSAVRSVGVGEPGSAMSEAYRMLRTSLQFEGLNRDLRVVMVTSSQHGEGKSTTVANLGVTLALDGSRVLLLDCDLRHHRLHEFFDVGNDPGLASILTGRASIDDAVTVIDAERLLSVLPARATIDESVIAINDEQMLSVLPAGPTPLSLTELLASRSAVEVFNELRQRYDYVLVDAPPVLPVGDVAVLTRHMDGVIFLTNDAMSRRGPIRRAVHLLTQVGAPVIGVVVNATSTRQPDGYAEYGGFYHRGGYGRDASVDRSNGHSGDGGIKPTAAQGSDAGDR